MAKREIAERIDGHLTVEASTPGHEVADERGEREATSDRRAVRSLVRSISGFQPTQAPRPARAPTAGRLAEERRRLERDLHDGVQNELVALIIKLALAQQDAGTPPALRETLAGLEARAQATLDSVRNIVRGIYPPQLADFGLAKALCAQAACAPVDVRLKGPRLAAPKSRGGCLLRLLRGDPERRKTRRPRSSGHAQTAPLPGGAGRAHRRRRSRV